MEGNHRDEFERKLEDPDGGGIVFTSNQLPGGNEQRIGGKNADMEFENVDDMSFLGGGYSPIGTPGFGGVGDDLTNSLDRGHQLFDKYTNHGAQPLKEDTLAPFLINDSIKFENGPKDSLPYYKNIYQHNGQYYNGLFQR